MPDNRRNLQTRQDNLEGDDARDNNGWPTPLNDRSNPLKMVVTHGKLGTTKDFRAMSTSGQGEISLPEGHGAVEGSHAFNEGLSIEVKKTSSNSVKGA